MGRKKVKSWVYLGVGIAVVAVIARVRTTTAHACRQRNPVTGRGSSLPS